MRFSQRRGKSGKRALEKSLRQRRSVENVSTTSVSGTMRWFLKEFWVQWTRPSCTELERVGDR